MKRVIVHFVLKIYYALIQSCLTSRTQARQIWLLLVNSFTLHAFLSSNCNGKALRGQVKRGIITLFIESTFVGI